MTDVTCIDPWACEVWVPVLNYEGTYEVSDLGRVAVLARRDARGWRRKAGLLRPWERSKGHYLCVTLCQDAAETKRYVHELVLEAFTGPRPEGNYGRHLDGDHHNNRLENLAWGTPTQNSWDRVRYGTTESAFNRTEACGNGHPWRAETTYWRPGGDRRCRICQNADARRRYHIKRLKVEGVSDVQTL
jgi:hypothetical protein